MKKFMKSLKKGASLLTAAAILLSMSQVTSASAQDYNVSDDFEYEKSGGAAVITAYLGKAAELTVPAELDGLTVEGIGEEAFCANEQLVKITLPDTLTYIADGCGDERPFDNYGAFEYCSELVSVVFPQSLNYIGDSAFRGCDKLEDFTLPKSLEGIGSYAFDGCESLKTLIIPNKVKKIGMNAFSDCTGLEKATIGASAELIGRSAFSQSALTMTFYSKRPTVFFDNGYGFGEDPFNYMFGVQDGFPDGLKMYYPAEYQDSWREVSADKQAVNFISRLTIEQPAPVLRPGAEYEISGGFEPSNAVEKELTWESSDPAVAAVEKNGLTSAMLVTKTEGAVTITAESVNGKIAEYKLIVGTPAQGIALNKNYVGLIKGKGVQLNAEVMPENASLRDVIWKSSNEKVATVEKGYVSAVGTGEAEITAASVDGNFQTVCRIRVTNPATALSLNTYSKKLEYGDKFKLISAVTPYDADGAVIYSSSNAKCAAVDSSGVVSAKGLGKAAITASIGSIKKIFNVTIVKKQLSAPKNIKLSGGKVSWSKVKNSSGYAIKIIPSKGRSIKASVKKSKTYYKIKGKALKKGVKCKIVITAKGKGNYRDSKSVSKKAKLK